jgi:nucleoside 2-deoxyribosyltransferase
LSLREKNQQVKAFLSHAYVDREIAGELRKKLRDFRIDVFVAHDDIEGGEEWMNMLIREIKACDIFLVLLTKEYHTANFTEQEAGAAVALGKPVIPISLNKAIGHGFVTKYQYNKLTSEMPYHECYKLAQTIYKKIAATAKETINILIKSFARAGSYDQANSIARLIEEYETFEQEQIRIIAGAYLDNGEIQNGFTAKLVVKNILRDHQNLLGLELKNRIGRVLDLS